MSAFVNLAADPAVGNILEVRMLSKVLLEDGLSRTNVNVFHYHRFAGTTFPGLVTLADAFDTQVLAYYAAVAQDRISDIHCDIRILDDPLSMAVPQSNVARVGAGANDPLSNAMAAVVEMYTGVRGRSFRGRKHLAGPQETDCDGGDELNTGGISNWDAVAQPMGDDLSDGSGNSFHPCVLSATLSDILGTPPVFTGADVTSVVLNHILGTMRKRKERIPS